jgi:hypothetical protein
MTWDAPRSIKRACRSLPLVTAMTVAPASRFQLDSSKSDTPGGSLDQDRFGLTQVAPDDQAMVCRSE